MPEKLSDKRPAVATTDLERLRFDVAQFVQIGWNVDEQTAKKWRPKARALLCDERLKGHRGYVTMRKSGRLEHFGLWRSAETLLKLLNRWLR